MDYLDFMKPRTDEVYTGSYRPTPKSSPSYFEYSVVNYQSRSYSEIINNIIATKEGIVIKTMWDCDWEINGFVYAQDGKQYAIVDIQKDMQNSEVVRLLSTNPMSDFIIALTQVENPERIKV